MNDNSIYLDKKNNYNAFSKNHYRIIIFYINNELIWFRTFLSPMDFFVKLKIKPFYTLKRVDKLLTSIIILTNINKLPKPI